MSNERDAREAAYIAWKNAADSGAPKETVAILKADFEAKRTIELNKTGQNEQVGYRR